MKIHANHILTDQSWVSDACLTHSNGIIRSVEPNVGRADADYHVDVLLPAPGNLHSHSFQRAMAGMTEFRSAHRDNFWTWRELMYRFLEHLSPHQIEAIAALVFMEMLEAGYASVGEFHYVHNQTGGAPYARASELSDRIFAAAIESGIGLTHLPVLYSYGGVNKQPLVGGQLRFGNDPDSFMKLVERCKASLADMPADTRVGIAPHSLRATSEAELTHVLSLVIDGPVHIHVAEQLEEVAHVESALGKRPVSWLLSNMDVDERWCLIHATHMTDAETIAVAKSGAVVGLCSITEANLGDGIFNGRVYLEHDGAFGFGSDSNVRISMVEEMRSLEYSQRLRDMARNILAVGQGTTSEGTTSEGTTSEGTTSERTTSESSVGNNIYKRAAVGSAQALNRDAGVIAIGKLADLTAIDRSHPALCALNDSQLLDGLCFVAPDSVVTDTWAAGRHVVQSGQHVNRDVIIANYKSAIAELLQVI